MKQETCKEVLYNVDIKFT